VVRFALAWKAAAGLALLGIAGTVGAVTYFNHTRPAALGLASFTPRPPASPSPDDPLALVCRRPAMPAGAAVADGVAGLWVIQPGSVAGYRAREQFAELTSPHEAVARTDRVSGWLLIAGGDGSARIDTGCVAVDVRTMRSVDELPGFNVSDRDQIAREFLGASTHPYAIFQPYPVALTLSAANTGVQHLTLAGDLEIRGTTKTERFALDIRVSDRQVAAAGSAVIPVDEFGVEVPREAGGFVQVDPRMTLEVSLVLMRA
jgi:hypothetical protein